MFGARARRREGNSQLVAFERENKTSARALARVCVSFTAVTRCPLLQKLRKRRHSLTPAALYAPPLPPRCPRRSLKTSEPFGERERTRNIFTVTVLRLFRFACTGCDDAFGRLMMTDSFSRTSLTLRSNISKYSIVIPNTSYRNIIMQRFKRR